ncbi:cysteine peptidase family C39 domain-containing protein [Kibdelosporangium phytohabitans]|uniref:Peptidase C39 domain-containing protein n=1 Tax=Kibdelosporangium phytohabitans TaxID=860235 RepID=A0A0N7F408_9PSEU|nr:cysteine peptidase family C39 domain-containing protein [Kibdelosporangium phytohabitans]ALG10111.1 hypothetical protein AOZ06_27295 [Kibdelosporangium phytohabitans]MBE1461095.1 hypothetical protein [Kibdelosporangium phytohabitans]
MSAYIGSGPYCYANSVAMLTGATPAVIETLTGSPFGAQIEGTVPYFDPSGWHPEIGVDAALSLLGWRCERQTGGDPVARLRALDSPAVAGPLDMGLLSYQTAGDGDHYVVVLDVTDDVVLLHDPHGHPYATLPVDQFVAAWEGKAVSYNAEPFVLRSTFVRDRVVSEVDALWASVPQAIHWLDGATDAVLAMASRPLDPDARMMWAYFGIRVGTRRLADASVNLGTLGLAGSAAVLDEQARLVGRLQHPVVSEDDQAVAEGLRRLAPTYDQLREVLEAEYVRVRG